MPFRFSVVRQDHSELLPQALYSIDIELALPEFGMSARAWAVRNKLEKNAKNCYGNKAEVALLLAERLGTMIQLVKVRGHHLNSASNSRLLLRNIPQYAWLKPY
jgi:hypothetical protein